METEIEEMLKICAAIRQLQVENNILRKHDPVAHIFLQNQSFTKKVAQFVPDIVALTFVKDVKLYDSSMMDELEKFVIKSTAGSEVSFGIATKGRLEKKKEDLDLNTKKLERLEQELERLLERVSNEGFRRSASEDVQDRTNKRVSDSMMTL